MKKSVTDFDVFGRRVLLRVDFNVPMKDGKVENDLRILEALPTIKYLVNNSAKVIICSHLGRPDGKKEKKYSLKPVHQYLKELFPQINIDFCKEAVGKSAEKQSKALKNGEILLLENIRFYPEEEANDEEFSKQLASLADMFVLDAFGTAHRKHCSTYGISKFLPSAMGLLMAKEMEVFDEALNSPKRPLVAILGGAKISDKLDVTENLLKKVNVLLIGGGMCFTFLKALKAGIGKSLVDDSKVEFCYCVIKKAIQNKVRIVLPVDFVCAKSLGDMESTKILKIGHIPEDYMGLDIGPKTIKLFSKYIKRARTVVWNGPLGAYEYQAYSFGTRLIAEAIVKNKKCRGIVGGGDVVAAVENYGLESGFYHVSTGGGASLKLLEGKALPAYTGLTNK